MRRVLSALGHMCISVNFIPPFRFPKILLYLVEVHVEARQYILHEVVQLLALLRNELLLCFFLRTLEIAVSATFLLHAIDIGT